ncbi:MAG: enoyl-CoA hydratase/isomerase family protein [Gammaproteobacteria bacterium]|nr:enoyl-CoA hydratase/isomerase family protein [Gammaproteobacteria bacterium]
MDTQYALLDVEEEIAVITLNRPAALNALSAGLSEDLGRCIDEVKERAGKDIKALILTGAGKAFCAGGDIKAMRSQQRTPERQRAGLRNSHHRMLDLLNMELPVISLVNGPAAGAGANLALAADFVFATPRAMFMQAFGRIGLVPDWGGFYVLPRLVGLQVAKELVFTARKVGAQEAQSLGMVHTVVSEDTALAETKAFAGRFRNASTMAIGVAKNILNQSSNLDVRTLLEMEANAQALCSSSDYHRAAVKRFVDKEPSIYDWEKLSAG